MITIEQTTIDGRDFIHAYSDTYKIRCEQTNNIYEDVYSLVSVGHTFVETDIPLEGEELSDTEALNIITQGNE